jgi:ABC-type nickel/cobalt efflux system permease component RcnA
VLNTRPRAPSKCPLSFSSNQTRPLVAVSQITSTVSLTERSKFGMRSALRASISQTQKRSLASQKTNGSVSKGDGMNHEHHDEHEHKHSLFGGHEHEHDHGTDAEKVIQALKGGGELSAFLAP